MFLLGEQWPFSLMPALLIAVPISVLILVYAYIKIRPRFPVRVDCWFCHKRSVVPYDNWNCWDCPHCEQYNGFSADGGYNKVIPAQHDELLNHSVTAKSSSSKKSPTAPSKTPFCRKCTINQDLKIQQLASFTPRDPARFDEEVEEYRQHLERAYQLCESCDLIVKKILRQQRGWLLDQHRQHQLTIRSQPTQRVIAWWQRGLPVSWLQRVQIASSIAALSLLASHNHELLARSFSQYMSPDLAYLLEIAPKYDHFVASILTIAVITVSGCSAYRRRIDVITAVSWFVLLVHKWLLFWPYLRTCVTEEDLRVGHVIVIGFTFLVNTVAAVTSRQICPSKQLLMKKLKQDSDSVCRGRDIAEHFKSSVAVDNSSGQSSSCPSSDTSLSQTPTTPAFGRVDTVQYSSIQQSPPEKQTSICGTFSPSEELEWILGKLSLGPRNMRNKNSSVFKTKSYSTASGENIFEHDHQPSVDNGRDSNLLRPSKLNFRRNVTQTSWVAGGYWRELGGTLSKAVQSGRNLLETSFQSPSSSPVSRTSSQSSGFHSHSSNSPVSSPNSYSGSMYGGDGDHFSVLSEHAAPTITCHCGFSMNNPSVSKLPFIGMQYYGGFPLCVPHVCPLSVAPTPSVLGPRNVPLIANSQYFQTPKHCFPSTCCFPQFPHPTVKPLPLSHTAASDAVSHSGSSIHSSNRKVLCKNTPKNILNIWQIVKQNVFLSVLCIGSVLFNVVGMGMLIYQNRFVFKLEHYFS